MEANVEQHRKLDEGIAKVRKFAETVSRDKFSGAALCGLIDEFAPDYQKHMDDEIGTILDLHDKIDSISLRRIDKNMRNEAEKYSDIFK